MAGGGAVILTATILVAPAASAAPVSEGPAVSARQADPKNLTSTPTPTIVGAPSVDSRLTATTGTWGPAPVALAYQWYRNGVAISNAFETTYKVLSSDPGASITVKITGSRSGYKTVSKTSAATKILTALTATPVPSITGTPSVGSTLTAAPGSWAPSPVSFAYQWRRNGTAIKDATKSTYKVGASDEGSSIAVSVTGSKSGYFATTKTSGGVTIAKPLTTAPTPRIVGGAFVDSRLTATTTAWGPAPVALSYQWLRNGSPIDGAVQDNYKVTIADSAADITVRITGSKVGFANTPRTSAPLTIQGAFTSTPTPTITGTATTGSTLTVVPGTWAPSGIKLSYQWRRDGVSIKNATGTSFKVLSTDEGKHITVLVTGTKSGYASISKPSAEVIIARPFTSAPTPTISGSAIIGLTLLANEGSWTPGPVDFTYQWFRNGVAVDGATSSEYRVTPGDSAVEISLKVTGSRTGYATVTKTSSAVKVEKAKTFATTYAPSISGNVQVHSELTATVPTWSPATTAIDYIWKRDGVAISGAANSNVYTLQPDDEDTRITVTIIGYKSAYASASRTSAATAAVTLPTPPSPGYGGYRIGVDLMPGDYAGFRNSDGETFECTYELFSTTDPLLTLEELTEGPNAKWREYEGGYEEIATGKTVDYPTEYVYYRDLIERVTDFPLYVTIPVTDGAFITYDCETWVNQENFDF